MLRSLARLRPWRADVTVPLPRRATRGRILFFATTRPFAQQAQGRGLKPTVVFTDGACVTNPARDRVGAVGVFFGNDDDRNVSAPLDPLEAQTNQRAELKAIFVALQTLAEVSARDEGCLGEMRRDEALRRRLRLLRGHPNSHAALHRTHLDRRTTTKTAVTKAKETSLSSATRSTLSTA